MWRLAVVLSWGRIVNKKRLGKIVNKLGTLQMLKT